VRRPEFKKVENEFAPTKEDVRKREKEKVCPGISGKGKGGEKRWTSEWKTAGSYQTGGIREDTGGGCHWEWGGRSSKKEKDQVATGVRVEKNP